MHWHDFGTDFSGCWKVSNFTRVYWCTDMTLGLTSLDAEKCPTSAVFNNALTWLWDWPAKDPLLSHVVLNGITQPLGHNSAISWLILDLFGTKEHPRIPLCPMWFAIESHNLSGEKYHSWAISWPISNLVQMDTERSPFVQCGSRWNQATSQWENGHNSAIS